MGKTKYVKMSKNNRKLTHKKKRYNKKTKRKTNKRSNNKYKKAGLKCFGCGSRPIERSQKMYMIDPYGKVTGPIGMTESEKREFQDYGLTVLTHEEYIEYIRDKIRSS
jgi:hypothetical protein